MAIHGRGHKSKAARGRDSTAQVDRAPVFGTRIFARVKLETQGHFPFELPGLKINRSQGSPGRTCLHKEITILNVEKILATEYVRSSILRGHFSPGQCRVYRLSARFCFR